jgi:multidrug efflux pump subunit AcrA (membrane-fusion protein)
MDVARTSAKGPRPVAWIVAGLVGILGLTLFLGTLKPAVAGVDRELVVFGHVQHGAMERHIYAWGQFVPDRTQTVRAEQPGKVAVIYAAEGDYVQAGDRLIELSSPEIQLAVDKAEQKFAAVRSGMIALAREQSARRLALESEIEDARAAYLRAEDELEEAVSRSGNKTDARSVRRAQERLSTLARGLSSDEERLELIKSSTEDQMSARRDELRWIEAILDSERARLQSLTLRATGDGMVEEVLVEASQLVRGGTTLARVALSDRLKAELVVYASDGEELEPGLPVSMESATTAVMGRISEVRSDPDGKRIHLTVALDENPRVGQGDDLDVKASIQLGTLEDAVFVKRPAYVGSNEWGTVFRISEDGTQAERVKVKFGRGSEDVIEVVSGLKIGDRVICSDTSDFDDLDIIEIK